MIQGPQVSSAIHLAWSTARESTPGRLIQKLIDDAPAPHRELLAYALYHAYLSIRFPELPKAPDPRQFTTLRPGHKRYIRLNDGIFIFDFDPPARRPRATLADALRTPRAFVYLFTRPELAGTWVASANAWPPATRKCIEVRTVPDWLELGIGLMSIEGWPTCRRCLRCLARLTNACLASFPSVNLRVVLRPVSRQTSLANRCRSRRLRSPS